MNNLDFRITSDFKVKQVSLALGIPFTTKIIRSTIQFYRDPNAWAKGIGSKCQDGRHVLFFDYDQTPLKEIIQDMEFLQERWKLSHAYIFQLDRNDSYHVIILDKFNVSKAYSIIKEANSDPGHRESIKRVRGHEWLLRSSKKGIREPPRWIGTLISKYSKREISSAHKKFIQILYGVQNIEYNKEDDAEYLPVISYNTGNRIDYEIPKSFIGVKNE